MNPSAPSNRPASTHRIAVTALAGLACFLLSAPSALSLTWAQSYGATSTNPGDYSTGSGYDYPVGIARMPDGGVVVAGQLDLPKFESNTHPGSKSCGTLVCYKADGTVAWQRLLKSNNDVTDGSGVHPSYTHLSAVYSDAAGNIYICGLLGLPATSVPVVAKLNASGVILWQNGIQKAAWPQPDDAPDILTGLTEFTNLGVTSDGGVVVVSSIYAPGNTHSMPAVVKFNGNGSVGFLAALDDSTQYLGANCVCQNSDGKYFVAITYPDGTNGCSLLKLGATGSILAERDYLPFDGRLEIPVQIIATPNGGCCVLSQLGDGNGALQGGLVLRKVSSTIGSVFEKVVRRQSSPSGIGYFAAYSLALTSSGDYLVGARDNQPDAVLARFGASGGLLSASMLGGPANESHGTTNYDVNVGPCNAIPLNDGGFAFTCSTFSYTHNDVSKPDWWIVRTDSKRKVTLFDGTQTSHSVSPNAGDATNDPPFVQSDTTRAGASSSAFSRISPNAVIPIDLKSAVYPSTLAFQVRNLDNETSPNKPFRTIQVLPRAEIEVEQPPGKSLTDHKSTQNFQSVELGSTKVKTYTIKNVGELKLNGLAITEDGAQKADFKISTLSKTTLGAGTSVTFTVTFKPSAAGTRNAAIHIASSDGNEDPFDIALTGMGAAL